RPGCGGSCNRFESRRNVDPYVLKRKVMFVKMHKPGRRKLIPQREQKVFHWECEYAVSFVIWEYFIYRHRGGLQPTSFRSVNRLSCLPSPASNTHQRSTYDLFTLNHLK